MATQVDESNSNMALGNLIAQRIAESFQHQITFAEYMDLALYHPLHGYYARNAAKIGVQGDFFTSPHLGADFGELLAEQFVQMWEIMGQPDRFTLVEMGAGQGLLALDVLRYLRQTYPAFFKVLEYIIVERAAALIAEQQHSLKGLSGEMGDRLRWSGFEEIPAVSIVGCFFSNELVDALPVHQVMVDGEQLKEIYVTTQPNSEGTHQFVESLGDLSTPHLGEYFEQIGIHLLSGAYPDRYRTEVNLAALEWMGDVADKLHQGYVLTIDYGYSGDRYYNPMRSQGTLQCYYHHARHSDPYIHIGQQDITAHVNFTALERQGERCGLQSLGFTKQGLFLMALGLGDRLAAIAQSNATDPQEVLASLRRRDALHQLIDPGMGLGNFGVLIQSKNVESRELLQGLKQGE
ncbi:class I SAM-dependent methyltransferase [Kovacikia minuta CCNUW1]|nr:class I SAM-dependent methyltransferase [Kovacikia minuta]UBF29611.1 class I SAM-dependent methyltransferase [Kovacikia minuta CCNUW1]